MWWKSVIVSSYIFKVSTLWNKNSKAFSHWYLPRISNIHQKYLFIFNGEKENDNVKTYYVKTNISYLPTYPYPLSLHPRPEPAIGSLCRSVHVQAEAPSWVPLVACSLSEILEKAARIELFHEADEVHSILKSAGVRENVECRSKQRLDICTGFCYGGDSACKGHHISIGTLSPTAVWVIGCCAENIFEGERATAFCGRINKCGIGEGCLM